MFFNSPDYRREEYLKLVSSFSLRILILIFLFVIPIGLFAGEKDWIEFTDNDSRGGWLTGNMIFAIPENLKSTKKLVLHWGNNPHQRMGMFLPIATLPVSKTASRMRIQFKSTRVPPGATHFLLYTLDENEEKKEVYSLTLVDKGTPKNSPQKIIFEQTGKIGNRVQGRIILTRAWDERDLSHYAVYWGVGHDTVLRSQPPVAVIEKKSWFGSFFSQLQSPWREVSLIEEIDILLPQEATHFIAFSRNSEGQRNKGVSFKLEDIDSKEKVKKNRLVLDKKPSPLGIIAGELILLRKMNEEDSTDYLFFWGKDEASRLENLPPLTKFEVKKIRDGLTEKEILVSSLTMMDQKLQVSSVKGERDGLKYKFPENTFIPKNATHILAFTQKKFWFQDDAERRLKGPIASVSLADPDGTAKKIKIKGKIKEGLTNFSISKFKNKDKKTGNNQISSKSFFEEGTNKTKPTKNAQEWRISEYRGIGLGLSISGLNGLVTFYDYNLDDNQQMHFAFDFTGSRVSSVFKTIRMTNESTDMGSIGKSLSGNSLEINRTLFSAVYRWFVDESIVWGISEGFYYGAGGGIGYSTLKYEGEDSSGNASISGDTETFHSTTSEYKHSTSGIGIFAVLDAGWQGLKNYYFQISLQPAIYVFYRDGFDETSIPVNPGQRSTVKDRWSKSKNPSRMLLGFGIFF